MRCPGCGQAEGAPLWEVGDRLFATTTRRFQVMRCPTCGLEFQAPPLAPEEIASFYPSGYWVGPPAAEAAPGLLARATEGYRRFVLRDHVGFVGRVVADQQARGTWRGLLDVGCGDGSFLTALGARPATGLDWSLEAVRAVQSRGFAGVRGGLEATPFAPGSFSVVTMFHYLEHVSPARPSLDAVRGLLSADGRLVVQVPNAACWQRALLRSRWAGYDPPRHLIHYATDTLRRTLEQNGFEVLRVTHASLRDNPTTLANSLAPSLYPPGRAARVRERGRAGGWVGSLAYLALVLAGLPFALFESACGRGAAVMMEARAF
jgi:SAM-dependent methyltransferase